MKIPKIQAVKMSRAEADRISADIRKANADLMAACAALKPAIDAAIRNANADLMRACRAARPVADACARATKPPRS